MFRIPGGTSPCYRGRLIYRHREQRDEAFEIFPLAQAWKGKGVLTSGIELSSPKWGIGYGISLRTVMMHEICRGSHPPRPRGLVAKVPNAASCLILGRVGAGKEDDTTPTNPRKRYIALS